MNQYQRAQMGLRVSFLTVMFLIPVMARAQAGAEKTELKLEDVFRLQHADDVQISPDGHFLAYARIGANIMNDRLESRLRLVDTQTGKERSIFAGAASSPRWAPDGKHLSYLANGSFGRSQIFSLSIKNNTTQRMTDVTGSPSQIVWSPNGRFIAFTMFVPGLRETIGPSLQKPKGAAWADAPIVTTAVRYQADGLGVLPPGHTQVFLLSLGRKSARQLTFGKYDCSGPLAWAPDSQHILFTSLRSAINDELSEDAEIFDLRLFDGTQTQLTHRKGPDQQATVSPDGNLIAYTGFDERGLDYEETRLYLMDRDGSHARTLGILDRDVFQIQWARDGKGVYVLYEDHGVTKVSLIELSGRAHVVASGLAGNFSMSDNGILAFPLASADHPADVAIQRVTGEAQRLTHLNVDLLRGKEIGKIQTLPVISSFDQTPIDAWMLTPPHYVAGKKYAAILIIHGGPYGDVGPVWSTDFEMYSARGYVVLFANERGSIGYGDAFSQLIKNDFPGHDYEDQMSVVEAAVALGVADPDRLFVTGESAGGEMTAWIVGKTQRFRAAVAEKPVINELSNSLETDQYTAAKELFGSLPWENPMIFWKHSPLSLAGKVRTPTLIMVGDDDHRTPITESEQYYDALKLCGVPTALVRLPGASHGSLASRPSQFAAEISITLAWFDRYNQLTPSLR